MKPLFVFLGCAASSVAIANPVCPGFQSQSASIHHLFVSPYTHHWNHDAEHKHVVAVSLTRQLPNHRRCGLSLFRNSFGQPSAYAFAGLDFPSVGHIHDRLYGYITAGILYGYVGPYQRKVPFNHNGFAPAIVPTVGYRFTPTTSAEVHVLGTAALMFGLNTTF